MVPELSGMLRVKQFTSGSSFVVVWPGLIRFHLTSAIDAVK